MLKTLAKLSLAALAGLASLPAVQAQSYPDQPVTIVVTFSPGGTTDSTTRVFTEALTQRTGQQFLVENLPGANGSIGTANVAAANPDGYRLVVGSPNTLIQNPYLYGDTGYTVDDFVPIARLASMDFIIVVRPDLGIDTIDELIAYAQEHPGELNFGSAGIGNTAHQAGELFQIRTGIEIEHIPYQGGALAAAALVAGEVDLLFNTTTEVLPFIESGEMVPLAVMSPERIPFLPDLPTLQEQGIEDTDLSAWNGLFAPAGTPDEIIDFLSAEILAILEDEAIIERLATLGLRAGLETPEELAQVLEAETPTMIELIDLTGGPQ